MLNALLYLLTLHLALASGMWIMGGEGEHCGDVCSNAGRTCNSEMQSSLTTYELVKNAFAEAGYECLGEHPARNYPGAPFSRGGSTGQDCAPFLEGGEPSSCTENQESHHRALCYCDPVPSGELPVDEWALVNSEACMSATATTGSAFDVSSEYTSGSVDAIKLVYSSGCVRYKPNSDCTKWGTSDERTQISVIQDDETLTHAFPIRGESTNVAEYSLDTNDFQFFLEGVTSSKPDYVEIMGPNQPLASSYRLIWNGATGSSHSSNSGSSCFEIWMKQVTTSEPTYEPTMATLEPTMATDEPTMATLEPTMATDEPTMATEEPTMATDEPTMATEEPTVATLEPTYEPTMATLEPTMATEEPTMVTLEPTMATDEPTMVTDQPTQATDEPTLATEEPTEAVPSSAPSAMPSTGGVVATKPEADSVAPTGDDVASSNSPLTDPSFLAAGCGGVVLLLCGVAYIWYRSSSFSKPAAAANSADVDAENPRRRSNTKDTDAVPTETPEVDTYLEKFWSTNKGQQVKLCSSKTAVAAANFDAVDAENSLRRIETKEPEAVLTETPSARRETAQSPDLTAMNKKDTSMTEYTFRGEGAPKLTLRDEDQSLRNTILDLKQENGELQEKSERYVRTRSGRPSRVMMEAVDGAETIVILEHSDGSTQDRRMDSVFEIPVAASP